MSKLPYQRFNPTEGEGERRRQKKKTKNFVQSLVERKSSFFLCLCVFDIFSLHISKDQNENSSSYITICFRSFIKFNKNSSSNTIKYCFLWFFFFIFFFFSCALSHLFPLCEKRKLFHLIFVGSRFRFKLIHAFKSTLLDIFYSPLSISVCSNACMYCTDP